MMTSALHTALSIGPLALYFFLLGIWNAGRHPRVVPGQVDFGFLALALVGFLGFGPVSYWFVDHVFPGPSVWASLVLPTFLGLLALLWIPRTGRRLVVYNVDPGALEPSLGDAIQALRILFRKTPQGYEDTTGTCMIRVEVSLTSRIGLIEAAGPQAEAILFALAPALRARLARFTSRARPASWLWFALAAFVLLGPTFGPFLGQPQLQAAVRVLIQHIRP
jgi:hypothetical protein